MKAQKHVSTWGTYGTKASKGRNLANSDYSCGALRVSIYDFIILKVRRDIRCQSFTRRKFWDVLDLGFRPCALTQVLIFNSWWKKKQRLNNYNEMKLIWNNPFPRVQRSSMCCFTFKFFLRKTAKLGKHFPL